MVRVAVLAIGPSPNPRPNCVLDAKIASEDKATQHPTTYRFIHRKPKASSYKWWMLQQMVDA